MPKNQKGIAPPLLLIIIGIITVIVIATTFSFKNKTLQSIFPKPLSHASTNRIFYVKDFGAKGDGVNNDTQSIQDALDAAESNGGGVVLLEDKRYFVTRALRIGSNTNFSGVGDETVIVRGNNQVQDLLTYTCPLPLPTNPPKLSVKNITIINKNYNCGNEGIELRNFQIDASLAVLDDPTRLGAPVGVTVAMSGIKDTTINKVTILNSPQDAIFIRNGGQNVIVSDNTIITPVRKWGNGAGINVELHGNNTIYQGSTLITNNTVKVNAPNFCDGDFARSSALATVCTNDTQCKDFNNPPYNPSFISHCGQGGSSQVAIGVTWGSGPKAPNPVISGNKLYVSEKHYGITCNGCRNSLIKDNIIQSIDSINPTSSWNKLFTGITEIFRKPEASEPTIAKFGINNAIINNQIIGSNNPEDGRGILVSGDLVVASRNTNFLVSNNLIKDKNLANNLIGLEVRGITNFDISNNTISNINNGNAFNLGLFSQSPFNTFATNHGLISSNTIQQNETGINGLELKETKDVYIGNNQFSNITGDGIEDLAGHSINSFLFNNTFTATTRNLNFPGASPIVVTSSFDTSSIYNGSFAYLSLLAATQNIPAGQEVTVKVNLLSDQKEVNSINAKIHFDQTKLTVKRIDIPPASFINNWTEKTFNNSTGDISLVGSGGSLKTQGSDVTIAEIIFTPNLLPVATSAQIRFVKSPEYQDISAVYTSLDHTNILTNSIPTILNITGSDSFFKQGDINKDGVVNVIDYGIFVGDFPTQNLRSDIDHSGRVDVIDYGIFVGNFGH